MLPKRQLNFQNPMGYFSGRARPPLGPGETYENVSAEIVIDFEKPNTTRRSKPIEFYYLAVKDERCVGQSVFTVPAHVESYTKTGEPGDNAHYSFQEDGVVVGMGSHLHAWDGGKRVDVFLNENFIAGFTTQRSSSEPWSWFSPRLFPFLRVNKGDTISISATYENPSDSPIRGAMGMIGFYFAPNDPGLILTKP
jgi:hypothetical protein